MREAVQLIWLPKSLMIGVPYELFWKLNPNKLKPFEDAYKFKNEQKREWINTQSWLNGLYVSRAISSCFSKDSKYPESPIGLGKEENQSNSKEIATQNNVAKFHAWALMFNKDFESKHK